jgi:hypothetical protein
MGVDDVVAQLELDVLDLSGRFELNYQGFLFGCLWRNGGLLCCFRAFDGPWSGLQIAVHEVDLLQPAKALADVLRPDLPHSLHRL